MSDTQQTAAEMWHALNQLRVAIADCPQTECPLWESASWREPFAALEAIAERIQGAGEQLVSGEETTT